MSENLRLYLLFTGMGEAVATASVETETETETAYVHGLFFPARDKQDIQNHMEKIP